MKLKSILILSLLPLLLFSQEKITNQVKKDTMPVNNYVNYGINIHFEGSFHIIKNDVDKKSKYFYQSIEIIRFSENNTEIRGQQIIPRIDPSLYLTPNSLLHSKPLHR